MQVVDDRIPYSLLAVTFRKVDIEGDFVTGYLSGDGFCFEFSLSLLDSGKNKTQQDHRQSDISFFYVHCMYHNLFHFPSAFNSSAVLPPCFGSTTCGKCNRPLPLSANSKVVFPRLILASHQINSAHVLRSTGWQITSIN